MIWKANNPIRQIFFRCLLLSTLLLATAWNCSAQQSANKEKIRIPQRAIGIHWELPVQLGIRYQQPLSNKFSLHLQAGILREPNSSVVLSTIELLGTDETTLNLIESAFQSGWVFTEGINYHFRDHYVGLFFSQVLLSGSDTPSDIVELIFEEDLTSFPRRRGRTSTLEQSLLLQSNLLQLGLRYGRVFPLDHGVTLFGELGISMNLGSKSTIESQQFDLTRLNGELDTFLDGIYADFAFIPSITFGVAKQLGR